jgi:hypothetical protein
MAKHEPVGDITPVYVSLATLKSSIQTLREHGLPPSIDRSAFASRSGADQSQIMSAFKFLGFIDKDDKTQPILKTLYDCKENSDEERRVFGDILRESYAKVFTTIDIKTATPAQLSDAIGGYGATGTTRERAVRFFVKAAEYAKIPLSGYLTRGTRDRAPGTATANNGTLAARPQRRRRRSTNTQQEQQIPPAGGAAGAAMKTISLPAANGTLTLSGTFNPFQLMGEERVLVYLIIDKMSEYENKAKKSEVKD